MMILNRHHVPFWEAVDSSIILQDVNNGWRREEEVPPGFGCLLGCVRGLGGACFERLSVFREKF